MVGSSAWRLAPTLGASVRQREGAGSPLRPASGSTLALFGNSHPSVYSSQAIAGIPPAPARGRGGGGGCPVTSSAVCHHQCGQKKVMNVTPPGGLALTQRQRNRFPWAAPGLLPRPSQGCCHKPLVWGVWAFFFPIFFMIKKQTQVCHFRMSQLSLRLCADLRLRDFCSRPKFKSDQGLKMCLVC